MMDWNNHSWDIQFQADRNDLKGLVNIGWFWSRPSTQTLIYYRKSRERWLKTGAWDQAVMNDVLREIEHHQPIQNHSLVLRGIRLDPKYYVNYMLTHWFSALTVRKDDTKNIYNLAEEIRYEKILNESKSTVMWHYTCVEKSLKSFFAKYYGQWMDIDGYYTKKQSFLSPINIGYGINRSDILLSQFLRSIELALMSNRTLIFPDIIYVNRDLRWPGVRTFTVKDLDAANISYVEPTFTFNRETKYKIKRPIPIIRQISSKNLTDDLRSNLSKAELVVLDFRQTDATNVLPSIYPNENMMRGIKNIRLCRNLPHPVSCLQICT